MRLPCGPGKGRAWAMRLKLKYLHCLSLQIGMARVHHAFVHFERLLQADGEQVTEQTQAMLEKRSHHQH